MSSSSTALAKIGQPGAGVSAWDLTDLTHRVPAPPKPRSTQATPAAGSDKVDATGTPSADFEEALKQASEREQQLLQQIRAAESQHLAAVEDAYQRGFSEGRDAGADAEAARLDGALAAADAAAREIYDNTPQWATAVEENICALAVVVARHILGREIAEDRLVVMDLVRQSVADFALDTPLKVRVSPDDYKAILGRVKGAKAFQKDLEGRDISWVSDPKIETGGCVVEGPDRIVDGRIDTALERAYRRLVQSHA